MATSLSKWGIKFSQGQCFSLRLPSVRVCAYCWSSHRTRLLSFTLKWNGSLANILLACHVLNSVFQVMFSLHFFQRCNLLCQIYRVELWHGCYSKETAKPQWWYSNDEQLLARLRAGSGPMTKEMRSKLSGESLTKRHRGIDGKDTWSGKRDVLKNSQYFGCTSLF